MRCISRYFCIYLMFLICSTVLSPFANAAVTCTEKITSVILHKNSSVYFTTDRTCPSWCQIKWNVDEDRAKAFTLMLTAKTTNKDISIHWNELDSCADKNITYSTPDYLMY